MKKKLLALVLVAAMAVSVVACGSKPSAPDSGNATQAQEYGTAVDVLKAAWEGVGEKFPIFGGSTDSMTEEEPGAVNVEDKDMFTYTFFIPEDVQGAIKEAASMVNAFNANTFTGTALKLDGMSNADAMAKLEDGIMHAQFMCGAPEKVLLADVDGYVVYAFGAADIIEDFKAAVGALKNVNGEIKLVDIEINF